MDSELLSVLGIDPAYIFIGMAVAILILLILIIVCLVKIGGLRKRYEFFMKGEDGKSLEHSLKNRLNQLDEVEKLSRENKRNIAAIFANLEITVQKIGMVKYDAFDESGGKLSFSLAILNKRNDGIVLNAVHTRQGCYTYIKEIIRGESVLVLTEEEKKAIDIAIKGEQE